MFSLFRKSDSAESFIWTDGSFKAVIHSEKKKELRIEYVDYCDNSVSFTFKGVEDVLINDPSYCVGSEHKRTGDKKRIELEDDDATVLSFNYDTVETEAK